MNAAEDRKCSGVKQLEVRWSKIAKHENEISTEHEAAMRRMKHWCNWTKQQCADWSSNVRIQSSSAALVISCRCSRMVEAAGTSKLAAKRHGSRSKASAAKRAQQWSKAIAVVKQARTADWTAKQRMWNSKAVDWTAKRQFETAKQRLNSKSSDFCSSKHGLKQQKQRFLQLQARFKTANAAVNSSKQRFEQQKQRFLQEQARFETANAAVHSNKQRFEQQKPRFLQQQARFETANAAVHSSKQRF